MNTQVSKDPQSHASDDAKQAKAAPPKPRAAISKKARLAAMLRRRNGASLAVLQRELDWQPHTVRAAISGLRKAGLIVRAEKSGNGKPTRYRIVPPPKEGASADVA